MNFEKPNSQKMFLPNCLRRLGNEQLLLSCILYVELQAKFYYKLYILQLTLQNTTKNLSEQTNIRYRSKR